MTVGGSDLTARGKALQLGVLRNFGLGGNPGDLLAQLQNAKGEQQQRNILLDAIKSAAAGSSAPSGAAGVASGVAAGGDAGGVAAAAPGKWQPQPQPQREPFSRRLPSALEMGIRASRLKAPLRTGGGAAVRSGAAGLQRCSFCYKVDEKVQTCSEVGCKEGVHQDCFKSAISKPPPGSADPAIRRARRGGKDLCYSHLNKFMPQVYL